MNAGRVVSGVVVALVVVFLVWMFSQIAARGAYEDDCERAGGVAVKSHLGPIVCIDRDAVIEVAR